MSVAGRSDGEQGVGIGSLPPAPAGCLPWRARLGTDTNQACIAQEHPVTPEGMSLVKLLTRGSHVLIVLEDAERVFAVTQRATPRVRLTTPDSA